MTLLSAQGIPVTLGATVALDIAKKLFNEQSCSMDSVPRLSRVDDSFANQLKKQSSSETEQCSANKDKTQENCDNEMETQAKDSLGTPPAEEMNPSETDQCPSHQDNPQENYGSET